MSINFENAGKIEQAKRAIGSILNLISYEPVATLDEARTRLRLIDEFALEAFQAVTEIENAQFPDTEQADAPKHSAIYIGLPETAGNVAASNVDQSEARRGNLGILQ